MTLTVFWILSAIPLLECVWFFFFLIIRLNIKVLARKITEIKTSLIISRVYTINMVYDYWRWPWSPVWSRVCQLSPCTASPCSFILYSLLLFFNLLIVLAILGLFCCAWASRSTGFSCGARALCTASLVVARGLSGYGCGLSCPAVCGMLLEQGLNLCSLHWQVDSELLDNQGNSILHSSEVNMHKPDLRRGELGFPFLRVEFLQTFFGILLHERFTYSPTFINLFIISMALWVVILWVKMPCYFICCFTQIAPGLATRDSFSWLLGSLWHISIHFFFFCSTFLPSGILHFSGLILCISCPNPTAGHFPYHLFFFSLENGIRNQDPDEGVLIATGVSFLLGPLSWQRTETYVWAVTDL